MDVSTKAGVRPGPAGAAIVKEVVTESAAFEALHDEWNELLRSSASDGIFLTHEWLSAWWGHLRGRRRLSIVTVRENGRLIAAAPLARARATRALLLPVERREFLGTGTAGSDHLDVIVRRGHEKAALEAIEDHFALDRAPIQLRQVRSGATASREIASGLQRREWSARLTSSGVCPFADLAGMNWESYLASRGSEHRYAFRRKLRRIADKHELRFERVRSEDRRRVALSHLIDLHRKRWTPRGGSDGLETPDLHAFHEEVTRRMLAAGWLRLYVLWLNDRAAAALYGFRYGDVFSFYQSGFDPELGPLSLGLVTMGLSIQTAMEEGVKEYDFLHGEEEYKFHWTRSTRELQCLDLFPPRYLGLAYRALDGLSRTVRRSARRVINAANPLRDAFRPRPRAEGGAHVPASR